MREVFKIESFEDLEKAFSGSRNPNETIPFMEEKALLIVSRDHLELTGSERFVLSDGMSISGRSFVEHCIAGLIGDRFSMDKAFR